MRRQRRANEAAAINELRPTQITVGYREYIERTTGEHVLGAKPYFTLENGALTLRNVPVPLERTKASGAELGSYEKPVVHDEEGGFGLLNRVREGLVGARRAAMPAAGGRHRRTLSVGLTRRSGRPVAVSG